MDIRVSRLQRSTTTGKVMEELERETLKDTYMSSLGYGLVVMWEGQWGREVGSSRYIKAFLAVLFHCVYHVQQPTTPWFSTAVSNIRSGRFLGLVECNISVPLHLRAKFSEMASIFKNVKVGREHSLVSVCFVWPDRGVTSPDQVICLWVLLRVSGLCCLASWLGGICRTVWPSPGFIGCYSTNGASRSSRLEKVCPLPEKKEILTQPRVLLRTLQSLFWQDYC